MNERWPGFEGVKKGDGTLVWHGRLQPQAKEYLVAVVWHPRLMTLPYVTVLRPELRPLEGGEFEAIPHLLFNSERPEMSGLCLFDPARGEWSDSDLIADTTIPWAAEWLLYYELWHMSGRWLGPSVGPESVAKMRQEDTGRVLGALCDVQ